MNQLNKKLSLSVVPGTVTERLVNALEEERKGGGINRALQAWVIAGFQLQELGGGILETWLALEKNGELSGMSKKERARVFIHLLNRLDTLETKTPQQPIQQRPPAKPKQNTHVVSLDSVPNQLADL